MRRWLGTGALLTVVMLASACGGGGAREGGYRPPAQSLPGPTLVVERFLQAANANDLETMTQLFGTSDRTIVQLDGRQQAEQRMYLLASLLRHEDFVIQGQRVVPGRSGDAAEVLVEITQEDEKVVVPHLVVRRKQGGWIIEKVDVMPLTNR